MKIKTVKVSDAATINLGNYESRKLGLEVEVVLDEGENPKEVIQKAFNSARKQLNDEIATQYPKT
jgi:hypothetical protein